MGPVVLLTDFGAGSCFVGIMKGVIRSISDVEILDLTHDIRPGNVKEAAFVISKSAKFFPEGSIFVCVVDPGVGTKRKVIAAYHENQVFLAPDNGLLSWMLNEKSIVYEVKEETTFLKPVSKTFHGRDIFSPTAALISLGAPLCFFGPKIKEVKKIKKPEPKIEERKITGCFLFADSFGNLITNIEGKHLKGKRAKRIIIGENIEIKGLQESFEEAKEKQFGAIIDSFGNLEIFSYLEPAEKKIQNWENLEIRVELD